MTILICRIGSLESEYLAARGETDLICRIGSLEIPILPAPAPVQLICRIGSLEKVVEFSPRVNKPYLPHRQLRKPSSRMASYSSFLSSA